METFEFPPVPYSAAAPRNHAHVICLTQDTDPDGVPYEYREYMDVSGVDAWIHQVFSRGYASFTGSDGGAVVLPAHNIRVIMVRPPHGHEEAPPSVENPS